VLLLKQHAKEIGPPACDHIHRVEILKKIFAEDMVFTSEGANRDKILAPGDFLKLIKSDRPRLNEIVAKHLRALNDNLMEIDST
jgi:hypothetical protein